MRKPETVAFKSCLRVVPRCKRNAAKTCFGEKCCQRCPAKHFPGAPQKLAAGLTRRPLFLETRWNGQIHRCYFFFAISAQGVLFHTILMYIYLLMVSSRFSI